MDDRTVAYAIAARPLFDDLRQVAAQLAGLLVLAATGSKESSPDHPMLAASRLVMAQAGDGVKRAGVLVSDPSRAHYSGLVGASTAMNQALACAGAWPLDVDAVLVPLRDAYTHLQYAAGSLPGFEIVSFEHACCVAAAR